MKFLGAFNRTHKEDPIKAFAFSLEIQGFARFGFSKVGGLKPTTDIVEYREGGQNTTPQKSPGQTKWADIVCERGVILATGAGDLDIINWYVQVFNVSMKRPGTPGEFRRNVEVVNFDKEGLEVRRWRVHEAWPNTVTPMPDLDALQSNNMIETMTLVHEGVGLVT